MGRDAAQWMIVPESRNQEVPRTTPNPSQDENVCCTRNCQGRMNHTKGTPVLVRYYSFTRTLAAVTCSTTIEKPNIRYVAIQHGNHFYPIPLSLVPVVRTRCRTEEYYATVRSSHGFQFIYLGNTK